MEKEIYAILKKHNLPLKKREAVISDLLTLLSPPSQGEVKECEHKNTTIKKGLFYCNDCPVIISP